MSLSRQQAFQQLRAPCVDLSAVALKFKGHQASVKEVSAALRRTKAVLSELAEQNALDEKLAEYAFFPLTHVFNESQRLSPSCLEDAILCVIVLVSKGWQHHIAPAMGKQLLILMSLIAGGKPSDQGNPMTDELKVAASDCICCVVQQLASSKDGSAIFRDHGSKTVVDQLVYMLLDSLTDDASDHVQWAAANALRELLSAVHDRVILASLLPRTASSLTQVLRTSTKARRTRKVLVAYLDLLTNLLRFVLADQVVYVNGKVGLSTEAADKTSDMALDETWLQATVAQVKLVLVQVMKLRNHENEDVLKALSELCFMVVDECSRSLQDALPVIFDTLVYLAQREQSQVTMHKLERLYGSDDKVDEILNEMFYDYCQSLPRVMLMNNEHAKQEKLGQIEALVKIASQNEQFPKNALSVLTRSLREGLEAAGQVANRKTEPVQSTETSMITSSEMAQAPQSSDFPKLLMSRESQREPVGQMQSLLNVVADSGLSDRMARLLIDQMSPQSNDAVSVWLALSCLKGTSRESIDLDQLLNLDDSSERRDLSRPYLISELYALLLPVLTEMEMTREDSDWRMIAMAVESTILQAQQLEQSYRPELVDTLYPILSLLGSHNEKLRHYAMTGLNLLAKACGYTSASNMLVENVDYLINSVGMKLNAFDVSPQAPQVLLVMLRLCGARIIPFIDDLVSSMFSALDNFHGYPKLVETLFKVLKTLVDESKAQPQLAIADKSTEPSQQFRSSQVSSVDDILQDLRRRKSRKRKHEAEDMDFGPAPHKPWTTSHTESNSGNVTDPDEDVSQSEHQHTSLPQKDKASDITKAHQLLLNIAQSTTPHLASSSPSVRHLLLDLLNDISPLLAAHEDTFLPLINAVWPSLIARLFTAQTTSDDAEMIEGETSYNIVAAANAVSTLCEKAGSFMSSRIDDVFPKLKQLFVKSESMVQSRKHHRTPKAKGAVILASKTVGSSGRNTSQGQILAALINLLTTILRHVRITDDIGDEITGMLFPYKGRSVAVKQALNMFNEDEIWLLDRHEREQDLEAAA